MSIETENVNSPILWIYFVVLWLPCNMCPQLQGSGGDRNARVGGHGVMRTCAARTLVTGAEEETQPFHFVF